ncbi:MAG: winged helix-turn-helix domain-containing protein [Vicingaceae bacterium]|nr:winged helix-turn-helix domain-containing protein [Vicingaceae bacterium]
MENTTYLDSKGIIVWIFEQFIITYSPSGITSLLNRLGFVYKKPVLTLCKVDVKKQEEFVEKYELLKQNLAAKDQIYFVDGVHPHYNAIATYSWIKKEKQNS